MLDAMLQAGFVRLDEMKPADEIKPATKQKESSHGKDRR
jgi:hypothetical protein